MAKRSNNRPKKKDTQQRVRRVPDAGTVDASTTNSSAPGDQPTKPAANKSKPPKPAKKRDVIDIERADSEGMAQPQGLPAPKRRSRKQH